jgi:hypothetical protein
VLLPLMAPWDASEATSWTSEAKPIYQDHSLPPAHDCCGWILTNGERRILLSLFLAKPVFNF